MKKVESSLTQILDDTKDRINTLERFREEYESFLFKSKNFSYPEEPGTTDSVTDGDILLLHPSLLGSNSRPIKAMVLTTFGNNWEAAGYNGAAGPCTALSPVSPVSSPAFSYEYKHDDYVFQMWNTRCVSDAFLNRCWKIDSVSQDTVDNAFDVYQHFEGKPLRASLRNNVYIPGDTDDTRFQEHYYSAEKELLNDIEL